MSKRIKITEDRLRIGSTTYHKHDVRTLDDDEADYLINMGWAKDVVTGETGQRSTAPVEIAPRDMETRMT